MIGNIPQNLRLQGWARALGVSPALYPQLPPRSGEQGQSLLTGTGMERSSFGSAGRARGVGMFMLEFCFTTEWIPFCSFSQSLIFFRVVLR